MRITKTADYNYVTDLPVFSLETPIYEIKINKDLIVRELSSSNERISSNPSDSHFEDYIINFQQSPETEKLCKTIDSVFYDRYSKDYNITAYEKWAHIQQPLENANPHSHHPHTLSFVYYVQIPKGAGDLVFILDEKVAQIPVTPGEQMLIIFPSWTRHKVNKNLSNDLRISISGNYNLTPL